MDYIIRFATDNDIENIMQFINEYWKKGHILSRNRELFEWQYGGKSGRINIVIGLDQNHTIQGMLGFIPYADSDEKDISLALWKANPSAAFLGIRLIKFLMEHEPHREIVCPGINLQTTAKIYRHINMKVGTMSQWYRLSPQKKYLIAKIANHTIPVFNNSDSNAKLIKINTPSELNKIFNSASPSYTLGIPFKSIPYIIKRYFKNPIYKYLIYALKGETKKSETLFVFRMQDYNGSHVLRLIDCIGKQTDLGRITKELDILLESLGCEYIDMYETGLNDAMLLSAGWKKAEGDGNIIPDYFYPFEQRKVDIHYSSSNQSVVLFKGDGDQDRPN